MYLTSHELFYFAGQSVLWGILLITLTLAITKLRKKTSMVWPVLLALLLAFASSLAPLFQRLAVALPGLGGPDANMEEFYLSFFMTLPQTLAYALLLGVVFRLTTQLQRLKHAQPQG